MCNKLEIAAESIRGGIFTTTFVTVKELKRDCLLFLQIPGSLVFTQDSADLSEGSTATFICQDTERALTSKNTWSFQNGSLDIVLFENGALATGVNRDKYKLEISGTKLKIINLTANDSGNYRCVIHGGNGEILLSATASLRVKGRITGRIFFSLTVSITTDFNATPTLESKHQP